VPARGSGPRDRQRAQFDVSPPHRYHLRFHSERFRPFGRGLVPGHAAAVALISPCDSVMGSIERTREIRRRRSRRAKLKKLRAKFAKATNEADKAALLAKAQRVSPLLTTLETES
jgi:hypothetical protein